MVIDNNSGRNVRLDINAALAALVSNNSGDTEPDVTFPFMFWMDTGGTYPILKQRNEADSAWLELFHFPADGEVGLGAGGAELVHLDASDAMVKFLGTNGFLVPSGTTAQRPTGVNGIFRYNTDSKQFEGYANGAWQGAGGFNGYSAIVGSSSFATHPNLAAALGDAAVLAGSKILITENATINTTITISKANIALDFLPGVTLTNGTAGTGVSVEAAGCRIKGGRFSGFSTAISIASGHQYNFVTECRFASCTTEVAEADAAPVNVINNNISE
jgi:hypothetical protein